MISTKVLENKTPIEKLVNKKPDYRSLKYFGCLCFPWLRPYNSHKLECRSSPCTFLGYTQDQNGYECLTNNSRIIISRHVKFDEKVFTFTENSIKKTSAKAYNPKISIPTIPLHQEQSSGIQRDPEPQLIVSDSRPGHEFMGSSDNSSHHHNHSQESHQELEESNSSNSQHEDSYNNSYHQSSPDCRYSDKTPLSKDFCQTEASVRSYRSKHQFRKG